VESLSTLFEAEAKWRYNAYKRAKRVDTLASASASGSCRSRPTTYDCLNGVRLTVLGRTSRVKRECCRALS
jgi:hypothetical protein